MKTKAQALYEWFHGKMPGHPIPQPWDDIGVGFRAGWDAHAAEHDSKINELRILLRELFEFPDYPGPAEGCVSDESDKAEQHAWRERWESLSKRIEPEIGHAPSNLSNHSTTDNTAQP